MELDGAALQSMKKASPKPDAVVLEPAPAAAPAPAPALSRPQARAAVAAAAAALAAGGSGARPALLEFLAALLNAGAAPALPAAGADAACMDALADAAAGRGHALPPADARGGGGAPLAPELARAGVAAPGVTAAERGALAAGVAAGAGVAALAVGGARRLALALTAVAALSADALQADVRGAGAARAPRCGAAWRMCGARVGTAWRCGRAGAASALEPGLRGGRRGPGLSMLPRACWQCARARRHAAGGLVRGRIRRGRPWGCRGSDWSAACCAARSCPRALAPTPAARAQVRALGEAEGGGRSAAAADAATDVRGLLEGSTRINARRGGAGALPCVLRVPQARPDAHRVWAGAESWHQRPPGALRARSDAPCAKGRRAGLPAPGRRRPATPWVRLSDPMQLRTRACRADSSGARAAAQEHGALDAALAAAAAAVRAVLAAPAPPPGRPSEAPAAEAAAALQAAARALLRVAALSLERSGAAAAQLPGAPVRARPAPRAPRPGPDAWLDTCGGVLRRGRLQTDGPAGHYARGCPCGA